MAAAAEFLERVLAGTAKLADLPPAALGPPEASDADKKSELELAFRQLARKAVLADNPVERFAPVVDLAIDAAKQGVTILTTPHTVLEDVFDCLTLKQCEAVFGYMEDHLAVWTTHFAKSTCNTKLLKLCISLQRRMSTSQNTVFSGRILMFLASVFPLCERSGVNLSSLFHTSNATEFEDTEEGGEAKGEGEEKPQVPQFLTSIEADKDQPTVDLAFYRKLWSLQTWFSNPPLCYKAEHWLVLKQNTEAVLAVFSSYKLKDLQSRGEVHVEHADLAAASSAPEYFAKYLTSPMLLDLQLADSNFRRQIFVQFLVLFQYLEATVKFKKDEMKLRDRQKKWVASTRGQIFELMAETPPDGKRFVKAVKHILSRDEGWSRWKNSGCPSFEKQPRKRARSEDEEGEGEAGTAKADTNGREKAARVEMGSRELTRLWNLNSTSNLEACRSASRRYLPEPPAFFEEAIMQIKPENAIEKAYWATKDTRYCWRALRLLSKTHLHYFSEFCNTSKGQKGFKDLPDFLHHVIGKLEMEFEASAKGEAAGEGAAAPDASMAVEEDGAGKKAAPAATAEGADAPPPVKVEGEGSNGADLPTDKEMGDADSAPQQGEGEGAKGQES